MGLAILVEGLGLVVAGAMILWQLVCEALNFMAGGLAAVRFKQHQEYHPDAAEPISVIKTAGCNATKPNVGKVTGLSGSFPSDATIYQF